MTDTQDDYSEWRAFVDTLEGVLLEIAPFRAFYDGAHSSAAEHERSSRMSTIRERLATTWEGTRPTESRLDAMCRADPEYVSLLKEHKEGKAKLAELEVKSVILEHRIGIERAKSYRDATLARSFGG